jgi:hypothetical protein
VIECYAAGRTLARLIDGVLRRQPRSQRNVGDC